MSALEQEIIEKFRLLDRAAQERVRQQIEQEADAEELSPMSPEEWLKWAVAFGKEVTERFGKQRISSVDLLHEAREERLNDIMGSR